jgi:hypothetical protein
LTLSQKRTSRKRSKNGRDGGTDVYTWEGTTSRVMAADRPYGEFYDFYCVGPEYFGYSLVHYDYDACRPVVNKSSQMCDLLHRRRKYQGVYNAVLCYVGVSEKENVKVIELKVINLSVIHVRGLISNWYNIANNYSSLKIIFFGTSL